MEHHKQMKLISPTRFKVNHIHDPICLLQKIESPFILLSLNEPVSTVVKLGHHNGNLIF